MVLKANMPHILVVDDDDRIRRLLAQYLSKHGYLVITAEDAAKARAILKKYEFDLCVLDIMMPGEDGLSLATYIQKSYDLPVLLLTAKTEADDRIKGLEVGVDDYLSKPFEPKELLLRLQIILRRRQQAPQIQAEKSPESSLLKLHNITYSKKEKIILNQDNREINLTDGERDLLHILAQKPNIPIRREMLAAQLDLEANDRAVDVQITRLRKKIEPNPANPVNIVTLRGKGYMLKAEAIQ